MMDKLPPRQQYQRRWAALKTERSSWDAHWREISEYLLPRAGRFTVTDRNRGDKRHNEILDSTGTRALRIGAAGMMAGATSPARPWFRLTTSDPDLAEYDSVKTWLFQVTRLMRVVFDRSNTYRSLHSLYEELFAFGTAATIIEDNFDNVIHHHPLTIGEYAIATDGNGAVDTLYREFQMTVGGAAKMFGVDNLSTTARNLLNGGNIDAPITIAHAIEPRTERDYSKRDAKNMPWQSCYFETGSDQGKDDLLRESGYKDFRVLAPRWATSGGDIYGNGPGMDALGDIKQLQHEQLRKGQVIDYQTRPPLQVPGGAKGRDIDTLPGGVSYIDTANPNGGIRSAFEVNLNLQHLLEDIMDVRGRINSAFYADLFLMMASDNRNQPVTAREVAERHEEKLLMLGPVLERLHNELLGPKVDITFARIVSAGLLPEPPSELQGTDLRVEFVSMLAQAQRAVGVNAVDRLLGTVGAVAQFKPDVVDKIDGDQLIDKYAEMLGVDPDLVLADDKVAIIRKTRADQQAAMQQAENLPALAGVAKTLSDTKTSGDNALTNVARMFSGY